MLNTDDDILICDPEGEYAPLVEAMGPDMGSVIRVSAGGRDRLNAMYMVDGYGENDPIVVKSQFIMSLQLMQLLVLRMLLKDRSRRKVLISRIQRILRTGLALSAKLTEQSRVQLKQARWLPKQ